MTTAALLLTWREPLPSAQERKLFREIPPELIIEIFRYCSDGDISRVRCSSQSLNNTFLNRGATIMKEACADIRCGRIQQLLSMAFGNIVKMYDASEAPKIPGILRLSKEDLPKAIVHLSASEFQRLDFTLLEKVARIHEFANLAALTPEDGDLALHVVYQAFKEANDFRKTAKVIANLSQLPRLFWSEYLCEAPPRQNDAALMALAMRHIESSGIIADSILNAAHSLKLELRACVFQEAHRALSLHVPMRIPFRDFETPIPPIVFREWNGYRVDDTGVSREGPWHLVEEVD